MSLVVGVRLLEGAVLRIAPGSRLLNLRWRVACGKKCEGTLGQSEVTVRRQSRGFVRDATARSTYS